VSEFLLCATDGPGYSKCLEELRAGSPPLGDVCPTGCKETSEMEGVQTTPCSDSCADEFKVCVTESANSYAQCLSQLRAGSGRLGDACGNKQCEVTSEMATLESISSPSPPQARGGGLCSFACEKEFAICSDEGPGYSECVEELRDGTFRLGALCDPGCTLSDAMKEHDHSRCRKHCEIEFNVCVNHGPGYDACVTELNDSPAGSPLTRVCTAGCELTQAMKNQDDQGQAVCSEDCREEFKICASEGPGAVQCAYEIRKGIPPLGPLCDAKCKITSDMMTFTAPSPPPFPPVHECSSSCQAEFGVCVEYNPGGCSACRHEIDQQPEGSPLVEKGCSKGCTSTAAMQEWCPEV